VVDVRRLRNSTEQAGWIASRPDRRGHPGIPLRPALTGLPGSASIAPSARRRSPRVSQARETDQVAFFLRIVICYWSTVFGPMFRTFMVLLRSVPLACQPAILPWSRAGYNPARPELLRCITTGKVTALRCINERSVTRYLPYVRLATRDFPEWRYPPAITWL
jgi:hypothetical protein